LQLESTIHSFNNNPEYHGILLQLPLPSPLTNE
jgi:5,10-methylene-tetrahydrofolate dehydrogenase/methenyl tetrahydrofolate cyclohydrolase